MVLIYSLLAALLLSGCSSSPRTPTAPSPSTSSAWTLTGTASPHATVQYAGQQTQADGSGRFTFTHQAATAQALTVTGSGILDRRVWLTGGQSRDVAIDTITLAAPFDLSFYRQLARDAHDEPGAMKSLRRRATAPRFVLVSTDDLGRAVDGTTLASVSAAIQQGVAWFSSFGPVQVDISATDPGEPAGVVVVRFADMGGPTTSECGRATIGGTSGWIRLVLDCRCSGEPGRVSPRLVAHEVAHTLGFYHVDRTSGQHIMSVGNAGICAKPTMPSPAELFHAQLAYTRPPGNTDPDFDPSSHHSATSDTPARPEVVSCFTR